MNREITTRYQDPVDIIWVHAARQCGIQVVRDADVFASWDGQGVLRIGTPETLDPDDSLAQMILHEICHAFVEGRDALNLRDWGLDYDQVEHQVREHACLRLQAALADEYGMRSFFASTTDFRDYFDRIPADPLHDENDPAAALASDAMDQVNDSPWSEPVREALHRTAAVSDVVKAIADGSSIWSTLS